MSLSEYLIELIGRHPAKTAGAVLGFILGILVLVFGVLRILLVIIFIILGILIGKMIDDRVSFMDGITGIFRRK